MQVRKLLSALFICQVASLIGNIFNSFSLYTWYPILLKPSFIPPPWVFGIVWTILFILMGIALYLVFINKKSPYYSEALYFFLLQLGLNVFWTFCFFVLRNPLMAFFEILFLMVSIFITLIYFYKVNKISACLLIPYFLWVIFIAVLNYSFFVLNYVVVEW